jgi:putative transposase
MWWELDWEQPAREENAYVGRREPEEVRELVCFVRLELYNRAQPCGPKALRRRLAEHYNLTPLPSERTIARILARNGLTHGRSGRYPGEGS